MMKNVSRSILVLSAFATIAGFLAPSAQAQTFRTIRWAAIGEAVTVSGWPARTGIRLPADSVINYGYAGGTALRSGDSSFWTSGKLAQIFAYQPDIISIQLGAADSKPVNWDDSASFVNDYKALLDTLATMASQPRILVVYPTPVWKNESGTQAPSLRRGSVIANSIVPMLRQIAKDKGADTVNLHAPFLARQSLFADSITTSTTVAQDSLGRHVFNAFVDQSIRVMCVGNSITEATSSSNKQKYTYRLNMMLGKKYWVWNGGKSGWWMQRAQMPNSTYKSYVTDKNQMDTLFMRKPHFITVKLGTNDARKYFWQGQRFINDYRYFIDTLYNNMTPKPKFVLFKAYPAWKVSGNWPFPNSPWTADTSGINGDIIRDSLGPAISTIALSRPTQVAGIVDLYTPFAGPTQSFASDGVHPNSAGQDSMARVIYRTMLPIVTSIRAAAPGNASRAAQPAIRAVKTVRLESAKATARDAGLKSVDGKTASQGVLAPGVYVKPAKKTETVTR
jgi:lysophospholipase L1-like esterase